MACEGTKYKKPVYVQTLAAAYAEAGDFDSAIKWSDESIELLDPNVDPQLRERFSKALATYKDKKPMRQKSPAATVDKPKQEQPGHAKPADG
jgi:hypothetical protein